MKVETHLFGSVDVSPEKVLDFPNGLVGFEKSTQFMLVHENTEGSPTSYTLQSLQNPLLAFQIVEPTVLGFSYELSLTDAEVALLQTPAPEDVVVMQILFKKEEGGKPELSANLRAPLIINTKGRVGMQKIMEVMRSNTTLSNLSSAV